MKKSSRKIGTFLQISPLIYGTSAPPHNEDVPRARQALHTTLWCTEMDHAGATAPKPREDCVRAWQALHTRLNHCMVSAM